MRDALAPEPRRAAFVFLIGLFFGPSIVMWFLGRGRLGFMYLAATVIWIVFVLFIAKTGVFHSFAGTRMSPMLVAAVVGWAVPIVGGIVHAHRLREQSLGRPWFSRWFGLLPIGLFFFILPDVVRTFFFHSFNAPSGSMNPGLKIGDYFFVDKRAYGYGPYTIPFGLGAGMWDTQTTRATRNLPARGDVAVFRLPINPNVDYVKRIIGLPGDRVQMRSGRLILNGKAVETVLTGEEKRETVFGTSVGIPSFEETLPSGRSYFVLDARQGNFPDNTTEYVVPEGHLFALGDNRDNSTDSRFLEDVGYIPLENLVGKVTLIYGSRHPERILTWVK